jgi:MFS family permease
MDGFSLTFPDLYFLRERGASMDVYVIFLCWGSSFGPLIGGYMIQNVGWKWAKGLSAISPGLNLLKIIFFLPETRFDHKEIVTADTDSMSDASTLEEEPKSRLRASRANRHQEDVHAKAQPLVRSIHPRELLTAIRASHPTPRLPRLPLRSLDV